MQLAALAESEPRYQQPIRIRQASVSREQQTEESPMPWPWDPETDVSVNQTFDLLVHNEADNDELDELWTDVDSVFSDLEDAFDLWAVQS